MKELDRDILATVRTFAPHYGAAGVPHHELLSQLHLAGHWPTIKKNGRINLRVYAKAERAVQEAIERLSASQLAEQPAPTHVRLTEAGEAAAISRGPGREDPTGHP